MALLETTLRIDGMHCGACIRRVTQSLQSIPGSDVQEVRLGAARVRLAEGVSIPTLIARLGNSGYAAREEL